MLKKNYTKNGKTCRVTFKLPVEANAQEAFLCGEFNEWDKTSHPMKKLKKGDYSLTLSLEAGQSYRFRYWLDGERWENEWEADEYRPNDFGTEDSVITLK